MLDSKCFGTGLCHARLPLPARQPLPAARVRPPGLASEYITPQCFSPGLWQPLQPAREEQGKCRLEPGSSVPQMAVAMQPCTDIVWKEPRRLVWLLVLREPWLLTKVLTAGHSRGIDSVLDGGRQRGDDHEQTFMGTRDVGRDPGLLARV